MGNVIAYLANNSNAINEQVEENPFTFDMLDAYSKSELVNYIKLIKSKQINMSDEFLNKMATVELNCTELLPMAIELYKKSIELLGEHKNIAKKGPSKKKLFFVRPKFTVESVNETLTKTKMIPTTEFITLMLKPAFITCMNMTDITLDEYNESFNNTLTKKDMMGITKRLLRDMPVYHKTRFINTFNKLLDNNDKVSKIAVAKGSYVYKQAKSGPKDDISSFRMVQSTPNIVSVFHRILALRLNNYLLANKFMDTTIQKAGTSGTKNPIFEQFYKLKNVIKDAHKKKKSCAVLFLDISNAFGNLSLQQLYKILEFYSVSDKFIQYLKEYYSNLTYYVDLVGTKTEEFKWVDGLIQGCPLSPLLFVLAINYILTFLCKEHLQTCGYQLNDNTNILFTAYMDDICLICRDTDTLNTVFSTLVKLFTMIGLPLNKDKCGLMTVNITKETVNPAFESFTKLTIVKYLGEYIQNDGSSTETYIQFLRNITAKLIVLDKKNVTNEVKFGIFTSMIVPFVNRKLLMMYDIGKVKKLKIMSIIKPYVEKWGTTEEIQNVQLFVDVSTIINESEDDIIKAFDFNEENFDSELEADIDMSNYVLKNANVQLLYNQIDDDFEIDEELNKLEDIAV